MRMCTACQEGRHWDCGMQSWCECDCDPETAEIDEIFNPESAFAEVEYEDWDDDDPDGHSLECTCEHCIQTYPERDTEIWDDGTTE